MRSVYLLPVLLLCAAGCRNSTTLEMADAGVSVTSATASDPSDDQINRDIQARILVDRPMEKDSTDVKVSTHNGVVTLRGNVPTQGEKQRVHALVAQTHGVSSVVDELLAPEPNPSLDNDLAIQRTVEQRLAAHGAKEVHVSVAGGKVVLSGFVPTDVEKAELYKIAAQTPNVSAVDNQLREHPLEKP
jgi:hyperosmotically inducible protein